MSDSLSAMKFQAELKNPMAGVILAILFGPLGLSYSTIRGALIMIIPVAISVPLCMFFIGFPMLAACNIVSAIWAHKACLAHNQKLYSEYENKSLNQAA